jgi:c-di-GMP-binding flagellar brake protein YcgR
MNPQELLAERRWPRFNFDVPVVLHKFDGKQESELISRSYELSQGGMALSVSESTIEIGSPVVVSFSLPTETHPIRMNAIVRNQRGARCGLEFVNVADNEHDELLRFLEPRVGVRDN